MLFGWWSSLREPLRVLVSCLYWSSVEFLSFPGLGSFPQLFVRLPELCPVFGCGPLHLFLSATGWSLSKDSLSASITEYHWWCQEFAFSHGMGVKLLVGYFLSLCSIIDPAFLVDRTHCVLKVLWVGWYPYPSIGGSCLAVGRGHFRSYSPLLECQIKSPI